jgi:hypothetical protein
MSVPRKRRLPVWHLLTDEGGKYEFTISVCSISFGRTGACSGEVLERRGAVLLAMETEPGSPPAAAEIPQVVGLDFTHCLRRRPCFCSLSRPFVCLE